MKRISTLMLIFFTCLIFAQRMQAQGTITTFDAPGAGTGTGQGTFPQQNTPAGMIVGFSIDASNVNHGFVRAKDGTVTGFDVSAAGTGPGQGTFSISINPAGESIGFYIDSNGANHGFVRTP